MQQAIFIDRDGTLNKDDGYKPKLELYNDVPEFFERVKKLGLPVIVISNQSAIASGKTTRQEVQTFNTLLRAKLNYPVKFYYCPHGQTDLCACRKPEPGLIYKAAIENNITIGYSFMIGDQPTDIEAARNAGMFNYLVRREQNFSPSVRAYLSACHIPIYSLSEIMDQIEKLVYLQRSQNEHFRITNYRDRD